MNEKKPRPAPERPRRPQGEKAQRPPRQKALRQAAEKQPNEKWLKTQEVFRKIGRVFHIIGRVLFHLRKIFLTVSVLWLAFKVYTYAREMLPESVGVWLLENGDYQFTLDRDVALTSCLAVTGACLVLMFLSRRTIWPWVVSLFTLVLPFALALTNMYPA